MTPALEAAYSEPHRRYHTLAHVRDCLDQLQAVPDLSARERRLLGEAIWWHDAVYDSRRGDNEERSAELAQAELAAAGAPPEEAAEVARLVLLTKGHRVEPGDRLGAVLVSIDLSILGRPPAEYAAYAAATREEYAWVPDAAWRSGRAAVMERFLEADAIFPDPAFRARYEAQARENIAAELASLRGEDGSAGGPA